MGMLLDFEGVAPNLASLRTRVAERAASITSLRYRVSHDGKRARRIDSLAVENHLHAVDLPQDKDGNETSRLMVTRPLPSGEVPTWDLWLIRRSDDAYTLCYRCDHALQDGTAAAHVTRLLLDDRPGPPVRLHQHRRPSPRGIAAVVKEGLTAAVRSPKIAPAFVGRAQGSCSVLHADIPLDTLRTAGRAHDATINDVFLSALSVAIRCWHEERTGVTHPALPATMFLSVRGPGQETVPGNLMVVARIMLPCEQLDPVSALAQLTTQTKRLSRNRHRDASRFLLNAVPPAVGLRLAQNLTDIDAVTTMVSNIDFGPALVHQGVQASRAAIFTALGNGRPRCYASLTGYHDNARLTIVHDTSLAAVDRLGEHWITAVRLLAAV